jgi:hypothetical protein
MRCPIRFGPLTYAHVDRYVSAAGIEANRGALDHLNINCKTEELSITTVVDFRSVARCDGATGKMGQQ